MPTVPLGFSSGSYRPAPKSSAVQRAERNAPKDARATAQRRVVTKGPSTLFVRGLWQAISGR